MKKRFWIYLPIALIVLGLAGFAAFKLTDSSDTANEAKAGDAESAAADPGKEIVEGRQYALTVPTSASETEIWDMMHAMTHQKVIASDKWGIIEMNDESIDKAYSIVSASDFNSKSALLEILERWKAGDFSQADKDHNYIWQLKGGSVGRATGLMTPEQEQEFIENNFR